MCFWQNETSTLILFIFMGKISVDQIFFQKHEGFTVWATFEPRNLCVRQPSILLIKMKEIASGGKKARGKYSFVTFKTITFCKEILKIGPVAMSSSGTEATVRQVLLAFQSCFWWFYTSDTLKALCFLDVWAPEGNLLTCFWQKTCTADLLYFYVQIRHVFWTNLI